MKNYSTVGSDSVSKILDKLKSQRYSSSHNRYLSWEHCYNAFRKVKIKGYSNSDDEFLALHLVGYLASWGMYRGSSELLRNYDYLIHKDLIPIIFQTKYLPLFDIDSSNFSKNLDLINEAYSDIQKYYSNLTSANKHFVPTDTLITKIMLAVYGCIPAYDRFFKLGIGHYKITKNGSNKFKDLSTWLDDNPTFINDIASFGSNFTNSGINYPFMKLVDMYFWGLGYFPILDI